MEISTKLSPETKAVIPQQLMNNLLSRLPYFTVLADSTGKVIFANQAAAEIFGIDVSMISQKMIDDLFSTAHKNEQVKAIKGALNTAGHWNGEIMITRPNGTQAILGLAAVQINHQNDHLYLYSGQDMTGQNFRHRESCQFERYSTRGEMAGEISHELNNYLSIIMGNLELLGMGIAKGNINSLAPRIKSMRDGLTRITKFVEGLMSIARPEMKYELTDLRKFIETEVFYDRQDPRFNGIEFVYNWDENVPPVETVRYRLQQALMNIFSNACDALASVPTGKKRITISATYLKSDDNVRLSIGDNGCGMSEEDYQKLFRTHFTTKGPGHGFGMLAIKGGIKSQGGRVSAVPSPDGGACFTLELPRLSSAHNMRTIKVRV